MRSLLFGLLAMLLTACSEGAEWKAGASPAERGRRVYLNLCTACHNADPARPGSIGPEIAGSPRVLLEGKLLKGIYPPGYTPKRTTQAMPRFENLAPYVDALAAFLAQTAARPSS
jgi:mono/diheme cytochrome c family protein